jgi:hypothetical protein
MILEEFLKQIKRESADIEALTKRNYYAHLDQLFKMIAYDGDRLNKKHNLMITPYIQYIGNTRRDDFREDLSKEELAELIDSLKTDLDCMIFRISPTAEV